jgi:hypothetical protein
MFYVPQNQVEQAWEDGAHLLGEACEKSDGDLTPESLLWKLLQGDLTLLGHEHGWAAVQVQEYPTKRVLHVEAIYAPGLTSPNVLEDLKAFARHNRCSAIQGACKPSLVRLWKRKGFREAFTIMRFDL